MSIACIAGCGRIGFDAPPNDAPKDGTNSGGERVARACRTSSAYTSKAGLMNRYREATQNVSWIEARSICMGEGADLWVPDTLNEATSLDGDWVGITDVATEGVYLTVEGVPATFLPWEPGQPDGGEAEDCVRNNGSTFEDRECTDTRDFVCECKEEDDD